MGDDVETRLERRRTGRADCVVQVRYSTVDALFSEFTRNVNEGGVFIETSQPAPLESRVGIEFTLPGSDEPIKASGRVVRVASGDTYEPQGMAVEFDELDERARQRIDALVQELRSR